MRVNSSFNRHPLGGHAPLQAGHPVIQRGQFGTKPCPKSDLPCLLDRPHTRTMTTESMISVHVSISRHGAVDDVGGVAADDGAPGVGIGGALRSYDKNAAFAAEA